MALFKRRDGSKVRDRRCGRLKHTDERSRAFNVLDLFKKKEDPEAKLWVNPTNLDQGREGACVGFGVAHAIAAKTKLPMSEAHARAIYYRAQQLDPWEGEDYEGTSVLAGIKAAQEMGYIGAYHWAYKIDDVVEGVSQHGPAVIGVDWYEQLAKPDDETGEGKAKGKVRGGHCVVIKGVRPKWSKFIVHNSWGEKWGRRGDLWMSFATMERLMDEGGDVCFPTFTIPEGEG